STPLGLEGRRSRAVPPNPGVVCLRTRSPRSAWARTCPPRSMRAASPAPSRSSPARSDLLAKSPTGSGKTLAFAIPLVERAPRDDARPAALVLVPTRELAVQVSEEIESLAAIRDLR